MMKLLPKLAVFGFLASGTLQAQIYTGSEANRIIENSEKVVLDQTRGTVKYCSFEKPFAFDDKAVDKVKNLLRFGPKVELEEVSSLTDKLGFTHVKYQQNFEGVPVQGAVLSFHVKDNQVLSFSGDYKANLQLSTSATISASEAIAVARDQVKSDTYRESDSPSLMIYSTEAESVLAYKVDVFGQSPLVRKYVFVNAQTGEILATHERIHEVEAEGEAETFYSGTRTIITDSTASGFRLNDYSRGGGIITYDLNSSTFYGDASEISDSDNFWEEENHSADAALDAHWGTEVTYDYFLDVHGRDSYDGEGASINSYVDYGSSYSNAFWNGEAMTYGAGGGGDNPFPSIDVVAHEIVHGLTEYSAGLVYAYESGALNESFSDIFGIVIDFTARGEEYANYEMGEEIRTPPIRSMSNPNLLNSPDTYQGNFWVFGGFDNGGVHFNSGVQNYWFYLLVEGGTGTNDNDDDYSVQSIGLEAAADIAFRNLTVYLGPNSQYDDARTFSIQSAIDLYGECSDEVIAVTNAWHAVGVGETFDNAVIADFNYSNNYYCQVPATINFGNLSTNASSYLWSFGDGNSSTEENPSHTYTEVGYYSVTLEVVGESECTLGDTLALANLITVTDDGGPLSPSCTPSPTVMNSTSGISSFELLDITNSTGPAEDGYEDFSCTHSTQLTTGTINTLTAQLYGAEYLHIWIDLNADGSFSDEEKIYTPATVSVFHEFDFVVPGSSNLDVPLRMRVISSSTADAQSCSIGQYGQAEDYTVILLGNEAPPVANFETEDQLLQPSESIQFNDLSLNLPETWQWYFEGGSPETSTDQFPTVQYNTEGSFDVELIVANEFGADTLLMSDYISVVSSINMCEETSTTAISGLLYDSGGPDGSYSNNEFCTLLISPGCAQSITLSFDQFQLESGWESFRVYDGNDDSGTLILNTSGTSLPPDVTAESGEMFIRFTSDGSVTYSGWVATWTSETPTDNPVAEISVSDESPALSEQIQFTDGSTNFPATWFWDFGDGTTSIEQNPVHSYSSSGVYEVSMIVGNCFGTDTTTRELTVQEAPQFELSVADSLALSLSCGASVDTSFYVYNNGAGDLLLNTESSGNGGSSLEVLALTTYADLFNEYPNALSAIDAHFTDYTLSESDAITAEELNAALEGMDILLIPEQEYFYLYSFFSEISGAVTEFVENGGGLLICGNESVGGLGVFPAVDYYTSSFFPLSVTNSDYAITDNVELIFTAPPTTFTHGWGQSEEVEPIVSHQDYSHYYAVAKQSLGEGNAIYCGFDYSNSEANAELLLANSLQYLAGFAETGLVDSLSLSDQVVIEPGDSLLVFFSVSAEGIFAGQYTETLFFETNDPEVPMDSLQIQIEVTGQPLLAVQPDILDYGELIVGFSATDTVFILNDGCADLELELSIDESAFALLGETNITIPPFSADTLLITFMPEIIGTFNGNLNISGNGGDLSVALSGIGLPAPEWEIVPSDTLFVTVPCGGISEDTFTIYNNGGSVLDVDLVSGTSSGDTNVLAITTYADIDQEYENTLTAINAHFTDYVLSEFSSFDPDLLEDALIDQDILLIPEQEGSPTSFLAEISPIVNEFVENGGMILVCGSWFTPSLGLFDINLIDSFNFGLLNVGEPSHPIFEGLPSSVNAIDATFTINLSDDPEAISLAELYGLSVVAEKEIGEGKVVYVGFDFYEYFDDHARIIGNAMNYLNESLGFSGDFNVEFPVSIPAEDYLEITLTSDASGMLAGTYFETMEFETNDPENTLVEYVIAMEVTGEPLPEISTDEIVFSPLFSGQTSTDTLIVFNEGCELLTIDVSLSEGFFSASASTITVDAFSSDTLLISYAPLASGSHAEVLELLSDAGDFSVALSGVAAGAPTIMVSPENPSVEVTSCVDSVLVTFDVSNTGEALLEFNIENQGDISLEDLLESINENHEEITNQIPDIYFFSGGEFGPDISDGGGDMYDGGNRLNTNIQSFIPYTTGAITETTFFGENSAYFTRKVPGLFVLAANMSDVEFFRITGNLGADGSGFNQGGQLNHSYFGTEYSGFYTNTGSTGDPTINHLIIVEDSPSLNHQFLTNTSNEDHMVSGLNNTNRIYYLLFAGASFSAIQIETMQSIFETFVEDFAAEMNVQSDTTYQVQSGETIEVGVYIPVADLDQGSYDFPIQISSNVPGNSQLTVLVTVQIDDTPCSSFEALIDETSCSGLVNFENQSTNSPESVAWDFGDGNTSTQDNPTHGYTEPGTYTVVLTVCTDDVCTSSEQTIEVTSTGGPIAAACQPEVTNFNYDMYFLQHAINDESISVGTGGTGYLDSSCDVSIELFVGEENSFELIFFTEFSPSFLRAQIDYNNDGIFTPDEFIFNGPSSTWDEWSFVVPAGTVLNQPLRYRLMISNTSINGCTVNVGRIRDMSVIVSPVTEAPQTDFEWEALDECQRVYQFIDNSNNLPTSWNWNFGDGTTSSAQNPIHIFDEAGDFEVSLTAANIFGSNDYQEVIEAQQSGISSIDIVGSAVVGESISFSAITDQTGLFTWDFGDGIGFISTLSQVEHTYFVPGIFEVSVSINDDEVCNSEYSTILNILPLGVSDGNEDPKFLVFPNPSKGDLIIESPEGSGLVEITLYDAVGKRISMTKKKINERQVKLKIHDPVAGMYFLLLTDADGDVFRSRIVLE